MEINEQMLASYFRRLVSKTSDNCVVPKNLFEYDVAVGWIKKEAEYYKEMELLRIGIEYLLTHPEIKIEEYTNIYYEHQEKDLRRALRYMREKLWPEIPIPEESPCVELMAMDLSKWRAVRKKLHEEEAKSKPKKEIKNE